MYVCKRVMKRGVRENAEREREKEESFIEEENWEGDRNMNTELQREREMGEERGKFGKEKNERREGRGERRRAWRE